MDLLNENTNAIALPFVRDQSFLTPSLAVALSPFLLPFEFLECLDFFLCLVCALLP